MELHKRFIALRHDEKYDPHRSRISLVRNTTYPAYITWNTAEHVLQHGFTMHGGVGIILASCMVIGLILGQDRIKKGAKP